VRCALAGLVVTLFGVVVSPAVAMTLVNGDDGSAVLPAGHCLQAQKNADLVDLESRSQRFQLDVFKDGQLSLDDEVEFGAAAGSFGYSTWYAYLPRTQGHRASLCMTHSGDLVLRKDSQRVWHTGTAGKAPGGEAHLTNGGRLVIQTTTGRIVWSSRTTSVLLIRGDQLSAGATLVNRTYPGSTTRLRMSADGNLVLQRNHHTVWQTDTHTQGSDLVITATGRMAIRSPRGTTLWRSPALGKYAILRVAQSGRIVLQNDVHQNHCWVRPAHSDPECGTG
jgi:hypothetical protein